MKTKKYLSVAALLAALAAQSAWAKAPVNCGSKGPGTHGENGDVTNTGNCGGGGFEGGPLKCPPGWQKQGMATPNTITCKSISGMAAPPQPLMTCPMGAHYFAQGNQIGCK